MTNENIMVNKLVNQAESNKLDDKSINQNLINKDKKILLNNLEKAFERLMKDDKYLDAKLIFSNSARAVISAAKEVAGNRKIEEERNANYFLAVKAIVSTINIAVQHQRGLGFHRQLDQEVPVLNDESKKESHEKRDENIRDLFELITTLDKGQYWIKGENLKSISEAKLSLAMSLFVDIATFASLSLLLMAVYPPAAVLAVSVILAALIANYLVFEYSEKVKNYKNGYEEAEKEAGSNNILNESKAAILAKYGLLNSMKGLEKTCTDSKGDVKYQSKQEDQKIDENSNINLVLQKKIKRTIIKYYLSLKLSKAAKSDFYPHTHTILQPHIGCIWGCGQCKHSGRVK